MEIIVDTFERHDSKFTVPTAITTKVLNYDVKIDDKLIAGGQAQVRDRLRQQPDQRQAGVSTG